MSLDTLDDVLFHSMKDLLSAEKQFRDALTKLADAAEDSELADAFRKHHEETKNQIQRLEKGFELIDRSPRSEKCEAAEGLTKEGAGVVEEDGEAPAKDVALAGAGRKTEHYEIASYEDAESLARSLGHDDLAELLGETLEEERNADRTLEQIIRRMAGKGRMAATN